MLFVIFNSKRNHKYFQLSHRQQKKYMIELLHNQNMFYS